MVGRLAVQAARLLGAGTVIAVGRDAAVLDSLTALGADRTIALDGTVDLTAALRDAGGVDVIVGYLWGPVATAAIAAGHHGVRLVHVGDRAGAEAYRQLCEEAAAGRLDVPTEAVPLADVATAWGRYPGARHKLVLSP